MAQLVQTSSTNVKRNGTRILLVIFFSLTPLFLLSFAGLLPSSTVNCWRYEIDLSSGKIRYTRYIAFVPVAQHIEQTAISLVSNSLPARSHSDWVLVLTGSPGFQKHSSDEVFKDAFQQIKELERIWELGEITQEDRRITATKVLELWQQGRNPNLARTYLDQLWTNIDQKQSIRGLQSPLR